MTYPLVTTDWLAEHLNDPHLRVVDIRGHVLPAGSPLPHYYNHREDYLQAHIPGAVFVDWVHEITDPDDPRHAKIAKPDRYAALMSRLGIGDETFVVAYDDAGGMFAARLWWSLNYYGHPAAVLVGGWKRWLAENRPTTAEIPSVMPAQFTPLIQPLLYRDSEQVMSGLSGGQRLIDVRTPSEFRGEVSRAKRGGHIPSAFNLPRTDLLDEQGDLLSADALRAKFAALGITDAGQDVVFYCNAGVSASFGLLALRAAGIDGGAVYDGSWKDWGNDESKPIEDGT